MADWLNQFYTREVIGLLHKQFVEHKNTTLQKFFTGKLAVGSLRRKHDPLRFSYQVGKVPSFIHSVEFLRLLEGIAGFRGRLAEVELCVFGKGDYTVLSDAQKKGRGVLFLLRVNPNLRWDEEWGGFVSLIAKEGEVMRVSPQENALTVINYRGLRSFVKYVNHHAPSSFVLIRGFLVPK
ncbi:hypothetical protein C4580_01870 [Candidatus Woesearchaeota archaeon]|nr:MAG: hypothetical protein C4580_01870 [Candidatus Woesearchaeota archaeon]